MAISALSAVQRRAGSSTISRMCMEKKHLKARKSSNYSSKILKSDPKSKNKEANEVVHRIINIANKRHNTPTTSVKLVISATSKKKKSK